MKKLVIAEKPSVGRDIARVLHCNTKINGAIEGKEYVVTWALGHLVTLSDPESYDEKYKKWQLEHLPMLPDAMKLVVIKQTSKQYRAIKSLLGRKDISEIIIATDAGREGELVARWILEKAGNQKQVKRLWISSVTDKAIRSGFANLKPAKEYDNLYRAAVSRAEADWLVGINATRALTCKYNAQLSCGRVQTPTLSMIAKREQEIRTFQSKPYYGLQLLTKVKNEDARLTLLWKNHTTGSSKEFKQERIEEIKNKVQNGKIIIEKIEKKQKKKFAPLLYDLTQLQQEANQKFQFSAKETLNIVQRLYENYKVVTYPRTDSRYLTNDMVGTIKERLEACNISPYRKLISKLMNQTYSEKSSFVNNAKVTDHHAIIPTEQYVPIDRMSIEEQKIYDLIVKRFLAVLSPAYEYEQTSVEVVCQGEHFVAKGERMLHLGWKEVYAKEEEESLHLPKLTKENELIVETVKITEGKTMPPVPFTEATLLAAMENPVKYMESSNSNDIKILGETGGLGTVATRADIIEKLFSSFLIEKRDNYIYITSKAKQLLELVPADLKQPELTAHWEQKLSLIAQGKLKRAVFMKEIRSYTQELIQEIKVGEGKFRHENVTNHSCPTCGKKLLLVKGKNSTMRVCQDRECGYRETISRTSNARCPVCHKRMELVGKGEEQRFICACGHKEKLEAFQQRRKKEGAGVSKKEVNRYMKQMKKEEGPLNNPFAEAFSKLNL